MNVKEFKPFNEAGMEQMREIGWAIESRFPDVTWEIKVTFEDIGLGVAWYMLLLKREGALFPFQAFNPKEYERIMNNEWTDADTDAYIERTKHMLGTDLGVAK